MTYIAISLIIYVSHLVIQLSVLLVGSQQGVLYCYCTALQNGGDYVENSILSSIIYRLCPCRHIWSIQHTVCYSLMTSPPWTTEHIGYCLLHTVEPHFYKPSKSRHLSLMGYVMNCIPTAIPYTVIIEYYV